MNWTAALNMALVGTGILALMGFIGVFSTFLAWLGEKYGAPAAIAMFCVVIITSVSLVAGVMAR